MVFKQGNFVKRSIPSLMFSIELAYEKRRRILRHLLQNLFRELLQRVLSPIYQKPACNCRLTNVWHLPLHKKHRFGFTLISNPNPIKTLNYIFASFVVG